MWHWVSSIQSGMQASVEEFLIRLFHPIWNKQIGICQGIGKHGDSHTTRANKRSPWDTMHPGRPWALKTKEDQVPRPEIVRKITKHFQLHPAILDKPALFQILQIGGPGR